MKRASFVALLASIAALFGVPTASAGDHHESSAVVAGCDCGSAACDGLGYGTSGCCATDCYDDICSLSCGSGPGFYAEAEALFFKYNRADGMRVGDGVGEGVDSDYNIAPRLTFGVIGRSGLGARVRWFEYDETESAFEGGQSAINVDTYTVDIEAFERFSLNRCWDLELSAGVRYNEFDEHLVDWSPGAPPNQDRLNSFTGWGGIVGATASRNVGRWGGVYGRLRQAILVDDKFVQNENGVPESTVLRDSIFGVTEIAAGWEYTRQTYRGSLLTLRAGYEWQLWQNYSSSFAGPDTGALVAAGISGEEVFTGPADVGFDGFTLSAALQF